MLAAARHDVGALYLGLDTNLAALRQAARASGRKPSRGGAPNVAFVLGSFDELSGPFAAEASAITVYLPWGSLLAAALSAEGPRRLRAVAAPDASLEVVVSHDAARDASEWSRLSITPDVLADRSIERMYALAGWRDVQCKPIETSALRALGTTWAKKLAMAKGRSSWRLTARA